MQYEALQVAESALPIASRVAIAVRHTPSLSHLATAEAQLPCSDPRELAHSPLQLCQLSEASRLLSRMSVATHQAVHAGGADSFGEPAAYGAG
eukprot:5528703-Prymnesium_polylepis.1